MASFTYCWSWLSWSADPHYPGTTPDLMSDQAPPIGPTQSNSVYWCAV